MAAWRQRASNPPRFGDLEPVDMQLAVQDFSTFSIKRDDKKIKQPSFSAPSQMVTFVVGEEKETFLVHKEHACQYSPVLEKAFNGGFKEGQTQSYEMEDTSPDAFRVFVQWLYSQKLIHLHHEEYDYQYCKSESHYDKCNKQTESYLKVWVLAEKLLIPRLQNEVIDILGFVSEGCMTPFEIGVRYIYKNTTDNSPLRRFFVNLSAWKAPSSEYKQYPHLYPYAFLLDLATVFSEAVPPRARANRKNRTEISDYHVEEN